MGSPGCGTHPVKLPAPPAKYVTKMPLFPRIFFTPITCACQFTISNDLQGFQRSGVFRARRGCLSEGSQHGRFNEGGLRTGGREEGVFGTAGWEGGHRGGVGRGGG